jgi:hypothetical protein
MDENNKSFFVQCVEKIDALWEDFRVDISKKISEKYEDIEYWGVNKTVSCMGEGACFRVLLWIMLQYKDQILYQDQDTLKNMEEIHLVKTMFADMVHLVSESSETQLMTHFMVFNSTRVSKK